MQLLLARWAGFTSGTRASPSGKFLRCGHTTSLANAATDHTAVNSRWTSCQTMTPAMVGAKASTMKRCDVARELSVGT